MSPLQELRELSDALVGRMYRLEIGAAIADADGDVISIREISESTGIFYQRVQEDIQRLVACGLLTHTDTRDGTKYFKPRPTAYWRLCRAVAEEVRAENR